MGGQLLTGGLPVAAVVLQGIQQLRGRRRQHVEAHLVLAVPVYRHEGGGRHHLGVLGTDGVNGVGVSAQLQGRAQRQPLRTDAKRYVRRRLHGQLKPLVVRQLGQPGGQGFIGRRVLCLQEVHEGLRDLVKER